MKKKSAALLMACTLAFGCAVGGTMAWLSDSTEEVVNTFTIGDINIDLKEHDYITKSDIGDTSRNLTQDQLGQLDPNKVVTSNTDYKFVPGDTLPKDPYVTVKAGSEACYLFVKVTEKNNDIYEANSTTEKIVDGIIDYTIDPSIINGNTSMDDSAWNEVTGHAGFWYRIVDETTASSGASWYLLKDNKVTVNENVTKAMVTQINESNPKLKFEAVAVQYAHVDSVTVAWDKLPDSFKN